MPVFWLLLPRFHFWKGDWALSYVSTQIWDFPNIFLFLKIMSLVRQLVYQVCYTRYHISFYLWLIGSILKNCKVPKYYDQDCLCFVYTCFRNIFIFVKNNPKVKGLNIFKHEFFYTAYGGDTTFFLKDRNSIIELMNELNTFSNFSGLKPNKTNCVYRYSEWGSSDTLWHEIC